MPVTKEKLDAALIELGSMVHPNESEEEHQATVEAMRKLGVDSQAVVDFVVTQGKRTAAMTARTFLADVDARGFGPALFAATTTMAVECCMAGIYAQIKEEMD